MEKNEFMLAVNKLICNAIVDRKKMKELLELSRQEEQPFNSRYGLEKSIAESTNVLDHLWSVLGAEINYDLLNLCLAIEEEEAAAEEEEEAGDGE